jgi:hypothetical protein
MRLGPIPLPFPFPDGVGRVISLPHFDENGEKRRLYKWVASIGNGNGIGID